MIVSSFPEILVSNLTSEATRDVQATPKELNDKCLDHFFSLKTRYLVYLSQNLMIFVKISMRVQMPYAPLRKIWTKTDKVCVGP